MQPPIAQLMVVVVKATITAAAAAAAAATRAMLIVTAYSVRQVVAARVAAAVKIAVAIAALAEVVNCRNQLPSHRPIHPKIKVVIRFEVGVRMVLLAQAVTRRHC